MKEKIRELPYIADPTIEKVLEEFLADQAHRLKTRTLERYKDVIECLKGQPNGYGHQTLDTTERAFFERSFNAEGENHREFCQIFGPEKIVENLGEFLGYYVIRKVIAGEDFKRAAGAVSKKLVKWLVEKNLISPETAESGAEMTAEAARDLPKAERASRILSESGDDFDFDPDKLEANDSLEFDHYSIARLEPGKLWFAVYEGGSAKELGPVSVPKKATDLLEEGWDVSCAFIRIRGRWRIVEVANVYPL